MCFTGGTTLTSDGETTPDIYGNEMNCSYYSLYPRNGYCIVVLGYNDDRTYRGIVYIFNKNGKLLLKGDGVFNEITGAFSFTNDTADDGGPKFEVVKPYEQPYWFSSMLGDPDDIRLYTDYFTYVRKRDNKIQLGNPRDGFGKVFDIETGQETTWTDS
jgi:hypothetical protein